MKIGDIVTWKAAGKEAQFCVVGFYTEQHTEQRVAIVARLDPNLVVQVSVQELAPVTFEDMIALTANSCLMH